MATYKSAKKQLVWAMQVIEEERKQVNEMVDTYSRLLANAQEVGNEEDVDFWFEAFSKESIKLCTLEDMYFQIQHPDICDEDWK